MQKFGQNKTNISDVEYYIGKYNIQKQERLMKIRTFVQERFPKSIERIYYGIPTVEVDGKIILQYAAYKNHMSLIVSYELIECLQQKYPTYHYTRATVVLPDNDTFPDDFIKEICKML